jgi:hypothetical protein
MNNYHLVGGIIVLLIIFTQLQLQESKGLNSTHRENHKSSMNSTNLGFVKPEHRLLKIFSSISSGKKIKLSGSCNKFVYNKNTIDTSVNDRLIAIMKKLMNTINQISQQDYYMKNIENVYGLIDSKGNQRYIIDFFVYDTKNYYTIRLVSDIVIIDNEIYINYLNVQTGSNSTMLNKYDVKFNSTGILLDSDMFHENIANLFDNYYMNSFSVVGVSDTSLEYNKEDLNDVITLNAITNMYLPSSLSESTLNELESKDLTSYLEMYLPHNQSTIKNPSFCNKYKIEWDSYGVPHENKSDKNCYVNNQQTTSEINQPWFGPGVIYKRSSEDQYQWLKNVEQGNIIRAQGY